MTCEECHALLLALVEGELPTEQADAVRRTAATCPDCQAELARLAFALQLSAQLPMVSAPAALRERLLSRAQQSVASAAAPAPHADRAEAAVPTTVGSGLGRRWQHFVERFANGPQFGMATIMLLLVVGTIWVVPNLANRDGAPESVVGGAPVPAPLEPEPEALAPAEELKLSVDARHRRLRRQDEAQAEPAAAPQDGDAVPGRAATASTAPTGAVDVVEGEAPAAAGAPAKKAKRRAAAPVAPAAPAARASRRAAKGRTAAAGDADDDGSGQLAEQALQEPLGAARARAAGSAPVTARPEASADVIGDGVTAPSPPVDVRWAAARRARAAGHFREAVRIYEQLLAQPDLQPTTRRQLQRETLSCYVALGDAERATALRRALQRPASAASSATRDLQPTPPADTDK